MACESKKSDKLLAVGNLALYLPQAICEYLSSIDGVDV
jgi:hypothetical protein